MIHSRCNADTIHVCVDTVKKQNRNYKNLWLRNVFSDIPTLALDSIIFVSIAFGGLMPIWTIIWGQILTKWFFGVIDTPFMYLSREIISGKINLFGNLFDKKKINK